MKKTLTEKILSAHAEKDVKSGEVVFVDIDWALVQDGTGPLTVDVIEEMGKGVDRPDHRCVFLDHASPSSRYELSDSHNKLRRYAREKEMKIFDVGEGICHQLMAEKFVEPGEVVVGADSHTCTAGAFGSFASGFGSTDIAFAMSTGRLWLRIPEAINVKLRGNLKFPAMAKDLILFLIGRLGSYGATYKALEFTGEGVENLSMESRLTVCNMVIEAGAKNGIMPADDKTSDYIKRERGKDIKFKPLRADNDAGYERVLEINLDEISPQVAEPHCVDNVLNANETVKKDIKVDQVVIGTCTGGRMEDLRAAARILEGKKVKKGVRFIVSPASANVYLAAMREGLLEKFVKSGGVIVTPGCGPCVGIQGGVLGTGEVCVSTANRNFKGRMGCSDSFIYLASPATAAASAVTGKITEPGDLL